MMLAVVLENEARILMGPFSPASRETLKFILTVAEDITRSLEVGKEDVVSSGSAEVKFQSSSTVEAFTAPLLWY